VITTTSAAGVDQDLLETAWRLAEEYGDVPTGSVLRCFARAVRRARGCGVALVDLPAAADRIARFQLDARRLSDATATPGAMPQLAASAASR
jgi:hypothetical protein